MRHPVALRVKLSSIVSVWCVCAFALDPSLGVNQYAHTAWKVREGFAKGAITSIAQTPNGCLWLGMDFGLLRFDGGRSVPWQPPAGQHHPSDTIYSLRSSKDGTLWIGSVKGLASWKNDQLTEHPELAGLAVYVFRFASLDPRAASGIREASLERSTATY